MLGRALLSFAFALVLLPLPQASAEPLTGEWKLEIDNEKYRVSFAACANKVCADLVDLEPANDANDRPKVDHKNPDPALRTRPLLGLRIVYDVVEGVNGSVGKFYNPSDGETYTVTFTWRGAHELNARVCCKWGVPFLYQDLKLTRNR